MQGEELFEANVTESLTRKASRCQNRCSHCWHDKTQRCICRLVVPRSLTTTLHVKILVLQHSKEFLNPGDDAKLLLALLPPERCALYVYGRKGDLAALRAELDEAPQHTLLLWPGEGALTVDDWLARLQPRPHTGVHVVRAVAVRCSHATDGSGAAMHANGRRRALVPRRTQTL